MSRPIYAYLVPPVALLYQVLVVKMPFLKALAGISIMTLIREILVWWLYRRLRQVTSAIDPQYVPPPTQYVPPPPRDVNPSSRRNNCHSVTVANILRYGSDELLWDDIFGRYSRRRDGTPAHMVGDTEGVTIEGLQDILDRTKRLNYWREFEPGSITSSSSSTPPQTIMDQIREYGPEPHWAIRYGAAYVRKPNRYGQRTGHCLQFDPSTMRFICHQQDPRGRDLTADVENAERVVIFGLAKAVMQTIDSLIEELSYLDPILLEEYEKQAEELSGEDKLPPASRELLESMRKRR